jgi:hypothetical protein
LVELVESERRVGLVRKVDGPKFVLGPFDNKPGVVSSHQVIRLGALRHDALATRHKVHFITSRPKRELTRGQRASSEAINYTQKKKRKEGDENLPSTAKIQIIRPGAKATEPNRNSTCKTVLVFFVIFFLIDKGVVKKEFFMCGLCENFAPQKNAAPL